MEVCENENTVFDIHLLNNQYTETQLIVFVFTTLHVLSAYNDNC